MELFAVHVADVSLLGGAGRRRVGGIQFAVRHELLGAHGVVLAVRPDGDGALQIGAVQVHFRVPQDAQGLLVGVAVLIVDAAGDDRHFRQNRVQEHIAGGGAGAVVAYLQYVGFQIGSAGYQVCFGVLFHVAGEQEAGGPVVDAQDDGGIVGVIVLGYGTQHE